VKLGDGPSQTKEDLLSKMMVVLSLDRFVDYLFEKVF